MSKSKLQSISGDRNTLALGQASGIIKFYSTDSGISGTLIHEFQPAEHLQAKTTCLKFNVTPDSSSCDEVLAVGNVTGSIVIYSLIKHKVLSVLTQGNRSAVTDLVWESSSVLVSLSKDKTVTVWDTTKAKKIRQFSSEGSTSLCRLGANTYVSAGVGLQLFKTEENNMEPIFKYHGHSTSVEYLHPVIMKANKIARYFLSSATDSTVFYAWASDMSGGEPMNRPACSFSVKDIIHTMHCQQLSETTAAVAITTRKGYMRFFTNHFNGITNEPVRPISCSSELQVEDSVTGDRIPILGAHFVSSEKLLIFYGDSVHIKFEIFTVPFLCKPESRKVTLSRLHPSKEKKTEQKQNVMKTVLPGVSSKTSFLQPQDVATIRSVSTKRKRDEAFEEHSSKETMESQLKLGEKSTLPINNRASLLYEGLSSNDDGKVLSVIKSGIDNRIMKATVREMNPSLALSFIKYLAEFRKKDNQQSLQISKMVLKWMSSVMTHHMQHMQPRSLMEVSKSVLAWHDTAKPLIKQLQQTEKELMCCETTPLPHHQESTTTSYPPLIHYKCGSSDEESDASNSSEDELTDDEEEEEEINCNGDIYTNSSSDEEML